MKEEIFLYFIGTAGSGKSTISSVFHEWCQARGIDAILVNLDPGAENLPYEPDVDIRDWISLKEIMTTYELGPNGAQIACADMIALNLDDIQKSIRSFKSDYIIVDTPGQLELFVFREAGRHTVKSLHPERSFIGYLLDPVLARSPSGFASQLLLSLSTNFRLNQPQINLLSKVDLLSEKEVKTISRWSEDPEELYGAIMNEEASVYREINEKIVHLTKEFGGYAHLLPVSKKEFFGIEDLYNTIQLEFCGGEDIMDD